MRNRHVDAMLGVGIVFVVLGHRHQPEHLFFPAYTFHMALFFFISGSLATVRVGWREKLRLAVHKSKTQLLLYFEYNLFFGLVTWLLTFAGISLGYSVPSFATGAAALQSARDFFVVPFLDGHHYHLHLAAWFILQLYLVHLVFQLVVWSPRRAWVFTVLAASIPVTLFALEKGLADYADLRLTAVRTSFAFLFYLLGYVVEREQAALRRVLLAPITLAVCFVLVNVLAINFGNVRYNIVLGNIGNPRVWVPLCTTALIVAMVYQLCWHVSEALADDAFLFTLGRATLPILLWHFSVFFLVNVVLFALGLVRKEELSNNWFVLNGKQTWLLYTVPALCVPIWLDRLLQRSGALVSPKRAAAGMARPLLGRPPR